VRRPAGPVSQAGHSGGGGAPPGLTKKPCQELADDREVQTNESDRRLSTALSRREAEHPNGAKGPRAGRSRRKAGPAVAKRRK